MTLSFSSPATIARVHGRADRSFCARCASGACTVPENVQNAFSMRERHPIFDCALDPGATLWRYFDLPKFLATLQQRALYFSRADLLGDPMEGSFTRARAAEREALLANPPKGRTREGLEAVFNHNSRFDARTRLAVYVNCWHLGDHESMAMWQGYGGGAYGVAIRSTFGRLDAALAERFGGSHGKDIFLGRVRYLDYLSITERVPNEHNAYAPFPGFGPAAEPPSPNSTCAASRRVQIGTYKCGIRRAAIRAAAGASAAQLSAKAVGQIEVSSIDASGPKDYARCVKDPPKI